MGKHLVAEDSPRRVRSGGETPPPQGRVRRTIPYLVATLLIVVGLATGFIAIGMIRTHSTDVGNSIVQWFVPTPQTYFAKDRIYVMLLGIDYDYDDKGNPYSSHSRSDTIKIAGLDLADHEVRLLSVPRDMAAIVGNHETKINEAYSVGGAKMSDQVIGDFLGMPTNERGRHFDRYVVVRIDAMKQLVDAIGGIDVPVTEKLDYDDNWGHLHIHFKPGMTHMDGYNAQAYSRFRHDACSDPCRIKRQDQVINAIVAKLKNDKLNDLTHINGIIDVVRRNVVTDLSPDEERSLAWAFRGISSGAIKGEQIPYTDVKDNPYAGEVLVPDQAAKTKLVSAFVGPYVVPTAPPSAALAAIQPSQVHLSVRNGSGISGMARTMAAELKKLGYQVDDVGNADAFNYATTQIRVTPNPPNLGERLRADLNLPDAEISPTVSTTSPADIVTIVVGSDYATRPTVAPAPGTPATKKK